MFWLFFRYQLLSTSGKTLMRKSVNVWHGIWPFEMLKNMTDWLDEKYRPLKDFLFIFYFFKKDPHFDKTCNILYPSFCSSFPSPLASISVSLVLDEHRMCIKPNNLFVKLLLGLVDLHEMCW